MPDRSREGVAVIGMACIFPGAPNLKTYWSNIEAGVDAIGDVPESRWESVFYDPSSSQPDRLYCRRGGFIDSYASFDSLRFGVMPVAAKGSEPDQLLSLQVASSALEDAGYEHKDFPNERTGVVLGRGNYIGAGMTRLEQHVRTAQQLVNTLNQLVPHLDDDTLQAVKTEFQSKLGAYGPDTAIGLVPNLTASRISNRLDLKGPSYTVDGACASSLLAIDHAVRDLRSERCDVVLAGGVHVSHDVAFWSVFCQLGALSRSEQIRPFDQNADGLLIGEGLGVVVLKRLSDAEKDGDRIYAVIRGVGVSSDGRESSLMMPRVDGQIMAVQTAWEDAGLDPASVGLVEAHGTGTPVGDAAELTTLKRVFGPSENGSRVGLGSVKSMIGHTMPAAGIAGFIKAAMAVHHGVLPPTLHCNEPHPLLDETRFRLLGEKEAWTETVRRAGINAFGFGGINAHVVLESHGEAQRFSLAPSVEPSVETVVQAWSAASPDALSTALATSTPSETGGPSRLVVLDPTEERMAKAQAMIAKGRRSTGRNGIWYEPDAPLCGSGKLAFLYPGVEAIYNPNVADLLASMGAPPLPEVVVGDLETHGYALIQLERFLTDVLSNEGIVPDVIAGHSIGEWTGMITSGMIPGDVAQSFIQSLVPGSLNVPGVSFLAVGCGADQAAKAIEGLEGISVSHDNCPHQAILCGEEAQIARVREQLEGERVLCQELPFRSGFHSALFAEYVAPHQKHFEALPIQAPTIPLWSATTGAPYGDEVEAIRKLAVDHLVRPVQFRQVVEGLYEQGVRVFLQVGPGSLTGFVNDTLRGRPHLALSVVDDRRPALEQLQRVRNALFVSGLDAVWPLVDSESDSSSTNPGIRLELGVPLVRMDNPLDVGIGADTLVSQLDPNDPVLSEFQGVLRDVVSASTAVVEAYGAGKKTPELDADDVVIQRHLSVESCPALMDHCFFRQPEHWENVSDRFPVVPLTMLVEMMRDAAQKLAPNRFIASMEHLRAYKWLAVASGVDTVTRARWLDEDGIKVAIEGYAECVVRLADEPPEPPAAESWEAQGDGDHTMTGGRLYDERWMFHGPAYQGVDSVDSVTEQGVRGVLTNLPAQGALLDNAGQLFGYWVMVRTDVDRLAMPVMVERISWYGPPLPENTSIPCAVFVRRLGERQVRADMELMHDGRVWARIQGWTDQRFDTTERSWPVIRHPEKHMLAEKTEHGFVFLEDSFQSQASQEYFYRRYLAEEERGLYQALTERRQPSWLAGRIAGKDAVRYWLQEHGVDGLFPVEVRIKNDEAGQPHVHGIDSYDLRVSLAHKGSVAVAMVADGYDIGVDIERVEERSERFVQNALTEAEQSLLPPGDRSEWVTRFWCAKEAAGKARGTGMGGSPRNVPITALKGERICADGTWVQTTRRGEYVVGWTVEN